MSESKLVYMANQIARNLKSLSETEALAATAEHIRLYWTPRMREDIFALIDAGDSGLDPLAKQALETIRTLQKV